MATRERNERIERKPRLWHWEKGTPAQIDRDGENERRVSFETQSKARLYFNGKLDRALKRAVNVPRREGINYEAMDVERGSNDSFWNTELVPDGYYVEEILVPGSAEKFNPPLVMTFDCNWSATTRAKPIDPPRRLVLTHLDKAI